MTLVLFLTWLRTDTIRSSRGLLSAHHDPLWIRIASRHHSDRHTCSCLCRYLIDRTAFFSLSARSTWKSRLLKSFLRCALAHWNGCASRAHYGSQHSKAHSCETRLATYPHLGSRTGLAVAHLRWTIVDIRRPRRRPREMASNGFADLISEKCPNACTYDCADDSSNGPPTKVPAPANSIEQVTASTQCPSGSVYRR